MGNPLASPLLHWDPEHNILEAFSHRQNGTPGQQPALHLGEEEDAKFHTGFLFGGEAVCCNVNIIMPRLSKHHTKFQDFWWEVWLEEGEISGPPLYEILRCIKNCMP